MTGKNAATELAAFFYFMFRLRFIEPMKFGSKPGNNKIISWGITLIDVHLTLIRIKFQIVSRQSSIVIKAKHLGEANNERNKFTFQLSNFTCGGTK